MCEETSKQCNRCGKIKPLTGFYKKRNVCKICINKEKVLNYQTNKKQICNKVKEYYKKNSKRICKRRRLMGIQDLEAHNKNSKKWANSNKEKISSRKKRHVANLTTPYILRLLKQKGMKDEKITKEMIEIKRLQMQLKREIKQCQQ